MQTLNTYGDPIPEVQSVTTSAAPGQTLGGGFKLTYWGQQTGLLDFDVEPAEMKRALQATFSHAGILDVSRTRPTDEVRDKSCVPILPC